MFALNVIRIVSVCGIAARFVSWVPFALMKAGLPTTAKSAGCGLGLGLGFGLGGGVGSRAQLAATQRTAIARRRRFMTNSPSQAGGTRRSSGRIPRTRLARLRL